MRCLPVEEAIEEITRQERLNENRKGLRLYENSRPDDYYKLLEAATSLMYELLAMKTNMKTLTEQLDTYNEIIFNSVKLP